MHIAFAYVYVGVICIHIRIHIHIRICISICTSVGRPCTADNGVDRSGGNALFELDARRNNSMCLKKHYLR